MKKILVLFSILLSFIYTSGLSAQWVRCDTNIHTAVWSLLTNGNSTLAGTDSNGVYISANNGLNWAQTSLTSKTVLSFALNGIYIFAGTFNNNGIYLSTNNGLNWTRTDSLNFIPTTWSLAISGINTFAGTDSGVYRSTNNGLNWSATSFSPTAYSFAVSGNNIFAGTYFDGVYLSTNEGLNWNHASNFFTIVWALAISGSNIFAGTSGMYLSTDNGFSWAPDTNGMGNLNIYAIAVSGNYVFAGTLFNGVYISTNNGANWLQRNEGFPANVTIESFCIINNFIIAGTYSNGIWRRYIPELIGIEKLSNKLPSHFSLSQNYPNPYNPNTTIEFALPKSSDVKLVVYDISGREVDVLVNEKYRAGNYKVNFDGSKLSSGVYFYKLMTDEYIMSRKMILIK